MAVSPAKEIKILMRPIGHNTIGIRQVTYSFIALTYKIPGINIRLISLTNYIVHS